MRLSPMEPPVAPGRYASQLEGFVREYVERDFGGRFTGKLFEVATTYRADYVEVMVFIADLNGHPDLRGEATAWARDVEAELEEAGYPAVVYLHTYTPPVRRI
jgi:hypothetical protein